MPTPDDWEIAFAVNDPDNGNCLYRIEAVQLICPSPFSIALALDNQFYPPATVKLGLHTREALIKIGRKSFPIRGYRTWVGNWCWDSVRVSAGVAADILTHFQSMKLHGKCKFTLDSGWTSLWDLYQKGKITAEALEQARKE